MSIKTRTSTDGQELTISIEGRFDFTAQQEFRNAYRYNEHRLERFRVNLEQAEYMDSSALGMLLLLRDHAKVSNSEVVIEKPSAQIRAILETAHFDDLFTILPVT